VRRFYLWLLRTVKSVGAQPAGDGFLSRKSVPSVQQETGDALRETILPNDASWLVSFRPGHDKTALLH